MKQNDFEKYFKEIIMHASQLMMAKGGEGTPGEAKLEGFKQTSIFTGKPAREIAFIQMMEHIDTIKNMCLSSTKHPESAWKEALTNNIINSAVLYALLFDEAIEEGKIPSEEEKK